MRNVQVPDILSGREVPDQIKVVGWLCKKTWRHKIVEIELLRLGAPMARDVVLQCNLYNHHVERKHLCPTLTKAKQEALERWPRIFPRGLKISKIYPVNKSNPALYKKRSLGESYVLYNLLNREMILNLWGKRFEPNLRFLKNYFCTEYIDFDSGREQGTKPMKAGERLITETVNN